MTLPVVPDWLRIALVVLSFTSFLPQILRIRDRQSSSGISLYYLLFNLVDATEHLTFFFFFLVNDNHNVSAPLVNNPPKTGDWVNLAQVAIVWLLFLILFMLSIYHKPDSARRDKFMVLALYAAYLSISLFPELTDSTYPAKDSNPNRQPALQFFIALHCLFILPCTTILRAVAFFTQASAILMHSPSALSLTGLGVQATTFLLVAISWTMRMGGMADVHGAAEWFYLVGWPVVGNGIFAIGQGVLVVLAMWRSRCPARPAWMDEGAKGGKGKRDRESFLKRSVAIV